MDSNICYSETKDVLYNYKYFIKALVEKHQIKSICDVGGGANPLLDLEYINEKGIDYTILDISETELNKAPKEFKKIKSDISAPQNMAESNFDLVFSMMLAEHIENAEQFHKNIFTILKNGGLAVHFFPTLYAFPFFTNWLIPESLSSRLLNYFAARDDYQHAKFPAYYRWCRGPIGNQIRKYYDLGYEIVEYRGCFGHADYYNKLKPIKKLHEIKTNYLLKTPIPILTSYAQIVLKKA